MNGPISPPLAGPLGLCGIWGRAYVDMSRYIDTTVLPELDEEICLGLTQIDIAPTGGSLKRMGVVAPWVEHDPYADYGHTIARMSREELSRFLALSDATAELDPEQRAELEFGDETDLPLSPTQQRYLELRYGVYFPWKVTYHFVENDRWEDKNSGEGKGFSPEARRVFPRTVAFLESLPFREIGRCLVFGLEANSHAPAHRDAEPGQEERVGHSLSFCPRRNKRFYLADPRNERHTVVDCPAYWFNDADYHGVEVDPWFRYSIRADGVFEPSFLRRVHDDHRRLPRARP